MSYAIDEFLLDGAEPETAEKGVWYVRLKPHNPKLGHVLRSVNLRKFKMRFEGDKGWKTLRTMDRELLEELASLRQEPGNDQTPLALDIATKEEAAAIEQAEIKRRKAAKRAASVDDAGALRRDHLPSTAASRQERLIAARDLRDAERAGDVALPGRRRSPEPKTVAEVEAELDRLSGLRSKLLRDQEKPSERGRGAARGGVPSKPAAASKPAAPQPPRPRTAEDDVTIGD